MSIGYGAQSAASVPTPAAGEMNTFIDAADGKLKRKDPLGVVTPIESSLSSITAADVEFVPAGGVISTQVQAAIEELDTDKADVVHTQTASTITDFAAASDARIALQRGATNGIASLDSSGKIPSAQLNIDAMEYKGNWSASSNTPTLVDGVGNKGDFYKVSTNGTVDLGSGLISFVSGDSVIYNGATWDRVGSSTVGALVFQSGWNANLNSPSLASGVGTKGFYYVVTVTGSTNLDGITDWNVNDWAVFNGVSWSKVDNTDTVLSVFGRVGAITAASGDYTATQITNIPSGNISSTTVQNAIDELDAEKLDISHAGSRGASHGIATTSINGFMSASDKSKIDGIEANANAGITALTGEVSASGVGSVTSTISNAAVLAKVLTGFDVDWNIISSSDSILSAIQKLAGRASLSLNTVSKDVVVPSGYTWMRQTRTVFSGTTKVTIQPGAKINFI